MKTKTLSERAARIKPEYSPLPAPPNPHGEEARKALMEYGAQLLHNPPKIDPEPSAELTDEAMIAAAMLRFPSLARYAETARIETVYDARRDEWRACVTVTVWERGDHA